MPIRRSIRIAFDVEGQLARAFLAEQARIIQFSESSSRAAKSAIGRAALVEYLQKRGYDVEYVPANWGGDRTNSNDDAEQGQVAGVFADVAG